MEPARQLEEASTPLIDPRETRKGQERGVGVSEEGQRSEEEEGQREGGIGGEAGAGGYVCRICGFDAGNVRRLSQHLHSAHPITSLPRPSRCVSEGSGRQEEEEDEDGEAQQAWHTEGRSSTEMERGERAVSASAVPTLTEGLASSMAQGSDQESVKGTAMEGQLVEEVAPTETGKEEPAHRSSQSPPPTPTPPHRKPRSSPGPGKGSRGGRASAPDPAASATFGLNQTHVVCLPLVAEGLKLVWARSEQTQELDGVAELVEAFNAFPYPTLQEAGALARRCALPLDRVKVWFMMQRVRYGISWAQEDIRETRRKLCQLHCTPLAEDDEDDDEEEEEEEEDEDEEEEEMRAFEENERKIQERQQQLQQQQVYAQAVLSSSTVQEHYRPSRVDALGHSLQHVYHRLPAGLHMPPGPVLPAAAPLVHARPKKSKAQLMVLRRSFVGKNWPSEAELQRLQGVTGLSRNDIRKWFADSRYQLRRSGGRGRSQPDGAAPRMGPGDTVTPGSGFYGSARTGGPEPPAELELEIELEDEQEAVTERFRGRRARTKEEEAGEEEEEVAAAAAEVLPSFNGDRETASARSSSPPPSLPDKAPLAAPERNHRPRKKSVEQIKALRRSFLRCQWPTSDDYTLLARHMGLPRAEIIQWFGDTRYAVKRNQLRWMRADERQQIAAGITRLQLNGGGPWGRRRRRPASETAAASGEAPASPPQSDKPGERRGLCGAGSGAAGGGL